ncbi:MAG: hypothetical protein WCI11_21470 [Candidatus Methylumidiphilus sp.]
MKPKDNADTLERRVRHCVYDGGFWIRIFGRGISVVDKIKHPPLYSERCGKRKVYRIGRFGIEYLADA